MARENHRKGIPSFIMLSGSESLNLRRKSGPISHPAFQHTCAMAVQYKNKIVAIS